MFNTPILASNNPFATCPIGTDTILILDTFILDVNYEPLIGGTPYQGVLMVGEGGVINWSGNISFKLGYFAKVILINGGHVLPKGPGAGCNSAKALLFDVEKLATCNGSGAPHTFSDLNQAGCMTVTGICCNALIIETDSSGNANDLILCTPGDSAHLVVEGSGTLSYNYMWSPNIGAGPGPYTVKPLATTTYQVFITGIFDPAGPSPAYVLTCGGAVQIKVNSNINISATTTPAPCGNVASGAANVTVTGGTAPYKYKWSNDQTTKNLTNVFPGSYSLTVTDAAGCTNSFSVTIPILDNTPPTITCPASVIDTALINSCTTTVPNINAVFSDNCPSPALTYTLTGATTATGSGQLSNVAPFSSGITTVRYTVNDGSLSASCTFTVTVRDIQKPTASTPVPLTGIQCMAFLPPADPAVVTDEADNCGQPSVIHLGDNPVGGSGCPNDTMRILRRFRVIDAAGNSITVTQTIKIVDDQGPVFSSVPSNITVSCEAIPSVGTPLAADNCSANAPITYLGETRINGACPDSYTLRRRWRANDGCGNTSTAEQLITVQDLTKPEFTTVPANVTVACNAIPPVGNPAATDNCDASVAIVYDGETRTDGACPDAYTLTRRWTATDNCGNTTSTQQVIQVQDLVKPVFTFVPANVTVSCDAVPFVGNPTSTDNCDASVTITYDGETRANGACADSYTLTRRWTAADNCGNTTSAAQVITVQDLVKPTFTFVPANVTVSCESIPAVGTPAATDNCDGDVTVVYNGETRTNGACFNTYTLTRRWTATDNCGNTTSVQQVISVQDLTPPAFTFVPPAITAECSNIPQPDEPQAADNCSASVTILYLGQTRTDGACADSYTLTRRWSATDLCGNSVTAQQIVTVQDVTKPVFTSVPPAVTVSCDAIPAPGTPAATDNCDASVSISYDGQTRIDGACPNNYTLVRRWIATDNCGNTNSATQVLSVLDVTKPTFTVVPPAATVSCDAIPAPGTPTATDNCGGLVSIAYDGETRTDGICNDRYTLTRRWIATDACGNTNSATQVLTVQDVTKPTFATVPNNITVECDDIPVLGTPAAIDNCDDNVSISFDNEVRIDGPCADQYLLRRRWIATDNCGNTATAQQELTVQDVTKPVFTAVPANITVECDAIPAVGAPAATDNCDAAVTIAYLGQTRTDGACADNYTLTRRWSATDNCGNSTSTEQVIAVQDITKPVFTAVPPAVTVSCDAIPAPGAPAATDNCDASVSISYDGETRIDGACPNNYTLVRRWIATDNCGNTASATQALTVQDVTQPTFTTVPPAVTVSCDAIPAPGTPTATDNCGGLVSIAYDGETRTNGLCADNYTLSRRWIATDACGNTNSATQALTVQDVTKPTFATVPNNITVECDDIPVLGTPAAIDNCDDNVSISFDNEVRIDGPCADQYLLRRRWIATDNCGNTTTAEQELTVQDVTKPVFTFVPANITVECEAIPAVGAPAATDNCDAAVTIAYIGETRANGACADNYTLTRRWSATDNCGNATVTEQVITVQDNTAPVFTFVPPAQTAGCDNIPAPGTPLASDNCDNAVAILYEGQTRTDGACADSYTLTRRWVATDNCGNTASAEQQLTIRDLTSPTFAFVPSNITIDCNLIPAAGTPLATDNCDAAVDITYDGDTRIDGACTDKYTLRRRWTATDNCGNTASAEQIIFVQDTTKPVFLLVPNNITVECDSIPTLGAPIAVDNCDGSVTISFDNETRIDGACNGNYTLRRRWVATDNCGNTRTAEQELAVEDLTAPIFTFAPSDMTVNCDDLPSVGVPVAADNCDPAVTITYNGETRSDSTCGNAYILRRLWTAFDDCGNFTTAQQVLTVQDTTRPVFTFVPADLTAECDNIPAPGAPEATDNCAPAVTITFAGETRTDGVCTDSYTLTRRWIAEDLCGNTSVAEQKLFIQDLTKPTFSAVPPAVTVECNDIPAPALPEAIDNCDTDVAIAFAGETRANGACPDSYMLTRRWVATDNCGNTTSAEQQIAVVDQTPPDFTIVPANITVACDAIPPTGAPLASDNCDDNVTIQYNGETRTDGACPDSYTLTRRWTASDDCGNARTTEQVITVQDIVDPAFLTVPANITVECSGIPAVGMPTASDNCDNNVNIVFNGETRINGACPDSYTLRRRWTATDNCGNAATTEQILTVQDLTPPVYAVVPPNLTVSCDAVPVVAMPTANDNCDNNVVVTYSGETRVDGACPDTYTLTRRWVASDNCGNTASAQQVLTVRDVTPPVFASVPPAVTVECNAVPPIGSPTAIDNCDANASIAFEGELRIDGTCPDNYTLRRRWVATDNCGNTASALQIVTVRDLTPPVFTFVPAPVTVNCDALPPAGNPTATDNCTGNVSIFYNGESVMSSASPSTYTLSRTWTAADACNNTITVVQVLHVQDTVAPKLICPPSVVIPVVDTDNCASAVFYEAPFTSDNCTQSPVITATHPQGATFPVGTTVVVLTAKDDSGNTVTCSLTITVADTTAPVLHNCPANLTVTAAIDACSAPVTWTAPSVTDACDPYTITPTAAFAPGHVFPTGHTPVTYTAVDSSGNSSACSFTVTVQETVPPVLTNCPTDITLETTTCTAVGNWQAPLATDNCALESLTVNINPGTVFSEGATTITYKASDMWNNTATCSFTVTVVDIVPPQFLGCPPDVTVDAGNDCSKTVNWTMPQATDNCSPNPTVYAVPAPGSDFPVGYTTVQIFVQDPSFNFDTCIFKVTVTGPPLGFTPAPPNQSFIGCSAAATWTPPAPTGVCAPATVSSNYDPGHVFPVGVTAVVYTVTDTLGQTATTSFTITVTESIAPQFDCPASPVQVDISGAVLSDPDDFITATTVVSTCDGVGLNFNLPQAADNCDAPQVQQLAGPAPGFFPLGSYNLQFRATDDAGNTANCAVKVDVLPLEPLNPVISDAIGCPGDDITLSTPVIPGAEYTWTGPQGQYPNNNTILIENLNQTKIGYYTVQAKVNGCLTPLDSALVRLGAVPDAVDDLTFEVATNDVLDGMNVLTNDAYVADDFTVSLQTPINGLTDQGNGLFRFQAGPKNELVTFVYQLCSAACPNLCDEAIVVINVRETECSYIPNIITPNGDGINDILYIPCLETELYPDNSIVIYNQWGDRVYEARPYSNDPLKAWNGTLNGENGMNLPDATYYYIFKPGKDYPAIKGFVELFR